MASGISESIDDDIKALCEEAVKTFKVTPANIGRYRQEWRTDVYAATTHGRAAEVILEIRDRIKSMPAFVRDPIRPPLPLEAAEEAARVDALVPYPPEEVQTELIELPIGRDLFIARQKEASLSRFLSVKGWRRYST